MGTKITWNGPRITKQLEEAASRGLKLAAEHVLKESRTEVPIQEGTLERSGVASVDGLKAAVSYDTSYAQRVHEDMTARHDPGRKAKFLEDPLAREAQTCMEIIAAEVRKEVGG